MCCRGQSERGMVAQLSETQKTGSELHIWKTELWVLVDFVFYFNLILFVPWVFFLELYNM